MQYNKIIKRKLQQGNTKYGKPVCGKGTTSTYSLSLSL